MIAQNNTTGPIKISSGVQLSEREDVQHQLNSIVVPGHKEYEVQSRTDACDEAVFNRVNNQLVQQALGRVWNDGCFQIKELGEYSGLK